MIVDVHPTPDALMHAAAETFVRSAADALQRRSRFTVALSGGRTPEPAYRLLANEPYRTQVDWARVDVFWSDERCVPPDDPQSNYRMARMALLDHVPLPESNIHRIRGEVDPEEAAAAYERELRAVLNASAESSEATAGLDFILLGMGEDGHTASLFPGSAAVREAKRWVTATHDPDSMWRVTLTPSAINAAAEVVFIVTGIAKAATLKRVIAGPFDPDELPAQVVAPRSGRVRWLVDAEAANDLRR